MPTTREHLATFIREGKPLTGLRLRSVRSEPVTDGARVRREATPDELERVKTELGEHAAASRVVPFVWSTEGRADDGHVIKMQPNAGGRGMVLDRFRKSPCVLWGHRSWEPKIGEAVAYVDGDVLRALVSFYPRELDPRSHAFGEIAALRGYAASIQWETLVAVPAPDEIRKRTPWSLDILESLLLEGTLCNIACDEDAFAAGRAAGVDITPITRSLEQAIDEAITRGDKDALERMWRAAADPARPVVVDAAPKTEPEKVEEVRAPTDAELLAIGLAKLGAQLPAT